MRRWYEAAAGRLDPFVLVLEGSVPNEEVNGDGHWAGMGVDAATGQPILTNEWIDRLAPRAAAVLALGTCAAYGGVPAMRNNPTGAMGLRDYLGWLGVAARDPGREPARGARCSPTTSPRRCCGWRCSWPAWRRRSTSTSRGGRSSSSTEPSTSAATARASPTRRSSRSSSAMAAAWSSSDAAGRWRGATSRIRGWVNGVGGCPNVGGICTACTMPGFPDRFMPFMEPDAGSPLCAHRPVHTARSALHAQPADEAIFDVEPEWRRRGPAADGPRAALVSVPCQSA